MENCGIGACALNSAQCAAGIANMVIDIVMSLATFALFVASLGTSSAAAPAVGVAADAAKKVGKNTVKSMATAVAKKFTE